MKIGRREGDYVSVLPTRDWNKGWVWVSGQYLKEGPRNFEGAEGLNLTRVPQGGGKCLLAWEHIHNLDLAPMGKACNAGPSLRQAGYRQIQADRDSIPPGATLVFPNYGSTGHIATYMGNGMIVDNHNDGKPHAMPGSRYRFTAWVR